MSMTSSLSNPVQWLIDWFRGGDADSGVKVTLDQVLGDPSVYSAVRQICEHISMMPIELKAKRDDTWSTLSGSPYHTVVNSTPNELQTPFMFHSVLMMHAILAGNGRAAIVRDPVFGTIQLIPLLPSQTVTCMVDGRKWHLVTPTVNDHFNRYAGRWMEADATSVVKIPDRDVIHIMGLSYSGIAGLNLVETLRNAFGLGLSGQKAVSASFKNPKPGVIIHAPTGTFRDEDEAKEFMSRFNAFHKGVDNTNRAALLRDGMTTSVLPVSAQDAQWIEQRQFHRQDMAQVFGLESFIGDGEPSPYKSVGERNSAYLLKCLLPWMVKIEQEYRKKLLPVSRQSKMQYAFDEQPILRMDFGSSVTAYSTAITSRIMSPNEARQRLKMNPYDGGDEFYNPAITPGMPDGDSGGSEPESEDTESSEPLNMASRNVILAQMKHLIGIECQRVKRAASGRKQYLDGQKNFVAWQDSFYERWESTLARGVVKCGGSEQLAKAHCEESQRQLLHLAGTITDPKTWAAAVAELTETWADRVESITDAIVEVVEC